MGKLGGGGTLVIGIILILLGGLIQSDIIEWLLNIIGFLVVGVGVVVAVYGLVKMFSGGKGTSNDF